MMDAAYEVEGGEEKDEAMLQALMKFKKLLSADWLKGGMPEGDPVEEGKMEAEADMSEPTGVKKAMEMAEGEAMGEGMEMEEEDAISGLKNYLTKSPKMPKRPGTATIIMSEKKVMKPKKKMA